MVGKCMVALVTPFTDRNTVDVVALKELVIRLMQDGADGFVVCGTTAEVCTLTNEERDLVIDTVIEAVNKRVAVWVGCGTNCTKQSMEYMRRVEDKAIDGIMLVVPYYNRPSQDGLYQHFYYLAHHTKHPIMLYNVPKRTGVNLENETIERLVCNCENIVALKQASNDFSILESKIILKKQFKVLSGEDGLLKECMEMGGYGIVSVLGHLEMEYIRQFVDNYQRGVVLESVDDLLKKKSSMVFTVSNPCGIKYLLSCKGYIQGKMRLPLVEVNGGAKVILDAYFD